LILGFICTSILTLGACSSPSNNATNSETQKTINSLKKENEELKKQIASQSNDTEENSESIDNASKEKTLPVVGILEYTISSIKTEQVTNDEDNFTNAEYNFSGIENFPEKYYRTTISYKLKNKATSPFSLSSYQASLIDGDGMEYSRTAGEYFLYDENSNSLVQPETTTSGVFYLLSKNKPNLSTFKLNASKQFTDDFTAEPIGEAGTTEYK
ncbi:TPA: DUF4352 domain-containing protein, partial [Enterococcus faecium]|nr:DUF4352 domain-containing protein [Enterococcus faecium]